MSQAIDTSLTSVFGSASVLLQAHLGIGLVLGTVGTAIGASAAVRKRVEGTAWETGFRSVATAVTPAPLLVAYGLVQVRGGAADGLSTVGLCVSAAAVLFAASIAALGNALGDDLARASRVSSAIRAFGQALLVFGGLPAGAELWCASIFLRAGLLVRSAGAISLAVGSGAAGFGAAAGEMEPVVALGPLIASLALLDNVAWGPGSAAMLPFQVAPYALLLLGLVASARFVMCGSVKGFGRHGLDFKFDLDESVAGGVEGCCGKLLALIFAFLAYSACRVLAGTFSFSVSSTGFAVEWGSLMLASAAKLAFMAAAAYLLAAAFGKEAVTEEEESSPINGMQVSGHDASAAGKGLGFTDYLKGIMAPAEVLLLAIIAVQLGSPDGSISPLKYGFVLAHLGVGLQVVCLFIQAASTAGNPRAPAPAFDGFGTAQLGQDGKGTNGLSSITNICLQLGLLFGCLGMGASTAALLAAGAAVVVMLFPGDARATAIEVFQLSLGSCAAGLESFVEGQRKAREAAAARRAAAVARQLEEESEAKASKMKSPTKPGAMGARASAGAAKRKGK